MPAQVIPAGSTYTVWRPQIYWAPVGSAIPDITVTYGTAWPSPWVEVKDTVAGIQLTPQNPTDPLQGDRSGIVAYLPTGAGTVQVAMQLLYPTMDFLAAIGPFQKVSVAEDTTNNRPAYYTLNYAPGMPSRIMLGWDGLAEAGSLVDQQSLLRTVCFSVMLADDVAWSERNTGGSDAAFTPDLTLQATPSVVDSTQLPTNMAPTVVDPQGRFTLFVVPTGN